MKILMVAPQPFFEPRGTPLSVLGRLKALTRLGHDVDLLTYHVGQNVALAGVRIHRTPKIGLIRRVKIGPSLPKLMLDLLLFFMTVGFLLRNRYDLLHTHEEASFFGALLAKLFRIPHLYDMHSSPTEQLSNFQFSGFGPLLRAIDWIESNVVRHSDAVITICPALEERVRDIGPKVPHVLIENAVDESDWIPGADVAASAPAILDGKRVVLYAGTFEPYQGIDLLIDSARHVVLDHPRAMFLVVGGKPDQVMAYEDRVQGMGLSSYFHFTGIRPADEIPALIERCDVLVSPRTDGTNTPLKIYSYLKSGKPIVATELYTHTQVLDRNVAMLVQPNADAFADGIRALLKDPELAKRLGRRARVYFEARFSLQGYLEKTKLAVQLATNGGA